jgi:hypothetical protein
MIAVCNLQFFNGGELAGTARGHGWCHNSMTCEPYRFETPRGCVHPAYRARTNTAVREA